MDSKKIYIIRHGQTDFNLRGIVQGSRVDTELNETGKRQAQLFYDAYKHIPFEKIFTSSLKRTHQSVESFLKTGTEHIALPEFNEIDWGNKDGKPANDEDKEYYKQMVAQWQNGNLHIRPDGGENPLDVQERLRKGMEHLNQYSSTGPILLCMHGRAIRILLATLLNTPLRNMDEYEHSNLCLYILEKQGNKFHPLLKNDISHLHLL